MMLLVLLPSKCVLYCVRGMLNVLLYSMHSTLLFVVVVSVECVVFFLESLQNGLFVRIIVTG